MLFMIRHGGQSAGPEQEQYAIYDTSVLSQYVAYDSEDDISNKTTTVMTNSFQSIYTYIPQFFTGTDNINREFIRANRTFTTYAVPQQWSLIEICFAPYSGYNGYSYLDLSGGNDKAIGMMYNENSDTIMISLSYGVNESSTQYDENITDIRCHYDQTRVLITLSLLFIGDTVKAYIATDDGPDENDYCDRTVNSNIFVKEHELQESSYIENADTIAMYDLYPYIGKYRSDGSIIQNSDARIYSIRKFSGMGNISDNVLDRIITQHFEVDKALFLHDAQLNWSGS